MILGKPLRLSFAWSALLVICASGDKATVAGDQSPASRRPAYNDAQTPSFEGKVLLGGEAYADIFEQQLRLLWQEYWEEGGDWKGDQMNDATAFAPELLFRLYKRTGDERFYGRAVATCQYQQRLASEFLLGKRKADIDLLFGLYSALPYMQHAKTKEERERVRLWMKTLLVVIGTALSTDAEVPMEGFDRWRSLLLPLGAWVTLKYCEVSQDRSLMQQAGTLLTKYDRQRYDASKGELTPTDYGSLRAGMGLMAYAKAYAMTEEQVYLDRANLIVRDLRRHKVFGGVFFGKTRPLVGEKDFYLSPMMLLVEGFLELHRATGRHEYHDAVRHALDFAVSQMQLSRVYPAGIDDRWFDGEQRVVPFFAHHLSEGDGRNVASPDYCVGCNLMMLNHIWDFHHQGPENAGGRPVEDSRGSTDPEVRDEMPPSGPPPSSLPRITIDGIVSYHAYSNLESGAKKGLPVIIILGHPEGRLETLRRFAGKFEEPVLLIWCGLLSNLDAETPVDDPVLWRKKRQQFPKLLSRYQERFGFDPARVYLTGFSFSGVYAWMLAYDRPDLYAGVVAMSAVWYPEQIQKKLKSAESVVTVVVGGEKDAWLVRDLAQTKEMGRIIESRNPHSRFVVKPGEDHSQVAKYWVTYLNYVLQCSRSSTAAPAPIRPSRREY
jgi:hypothetical protein